MRWDKLYIMSSATAKKIEKSTAQSQTETATAVKKRTTEKDVLAYLRRRPDFFMKHTDLLDSLKLKRTEGNVTSLNTVRATRKEQEAEDLKLKQQRLMNTAALNADAAQTIFTCAVALSSAQTLAQVRTLVQTTFRTALELDATRLFLMGEEESATALTSDSILEMTEEGSVTPRTLYDVTERSIYGTTGKLMKSDVLLRLSHEDQLLGLVALASKDETRFHSGQSFELVAFLTQILSATLHRVQS